MTKEQAIELIKEYKVAKVEFPNNLQEQALEMAIKALEQQTDDCVSRKAVDLLCFKYLKPNNDDNVAFYEHFLDLPPVTPTFPNGATNGDMIKAMFPNQTIGCAIPITDRNGAKFYRTTINGVTDFTEDWWNALYKRGNENEVN